jgi:hypothetical protein
MKRRSMVCAALLLSFASVARAQDAAAEYQQVLSALGKRGDYRANVLKVNIPLTKGTGPAEKLASAFKTAVSETGKAKASASAKQ